MMLLITLCVAIAVAHGLLWWQQMRIQHAARAMVLRSDVSIRRPASLFMRLSAPLAAAIVRSCARVPMLAAWQWRESPVPPIQLVAHSLLIGTGVGVVVGLLSPISPHLCGVIAALCGAAIPWIEVRGTSRRRRQTLEREWERFLELLALTLDAGLELQTAIAKIFDQLPSSHLRDLLESWYREVRLGRRPESAWRQLAQQARTPTVEISVTLLIQALRFGTPLAGILRTQATLIRDVRLRQAEHAGAVASHKILIPVMVCMLPAYFLLTFGGILVRFLTGTWEGLW